MSKFMTFQPMVYCATCVLSVVFCCAIVCPVNGQTKVHEWKFENNLSDTSGSGNDGTGFFDSYVPGVFGGQAIFLNDGDTAGGFGDGIDNESASNLPIAGGASWSMNIWGKFATPLDSLSYIAGFGKDNDLDLTVEDVDPGFGAVDDGRVRGYISFGDLDGATNGAGDTDDGVPGNNFYSWGAFKDLDSGAAYLADDQWHMYTITYNGADISMYQDAALQATAAVALRDAAPQVHVGNPAEPGWTDAGEAFIGTLDEFTIFSGALSDVQIGGLFLNNDISQPVNIFPSIEVNRDTGGIVLNNDSDVDQEVLGYTIKSPSGGLNPTVWNTVANRFDAPPAGDGSVDGNDSWTVLTNTSNQFSVELSEGVPGTDGGTIEIGKVIDFGNAWIKNPVEDISIELLLNDGQGTILELPATFTGHGNQPFEFGDFDGMNSIDAADWVTFRTAANTDLSAALEVEAYLGGDLNGDGRKDIEDFAQFAALFDAANGAGAFQVMLASVPEPTTTSLLACSGIMFISLIRRTRKVTTNLAVVLLGIIGATAAEDAHAQLHAYYQLNGNADEGTGTNIDLTLHGGAGFAGSLHPGLGTAIDLDGVDDAATGGGFTQITGNDITVVAWVYLEDADAAWDSIVKNWGSATTIGQFHFGLGQGGNNMLNNFLTQTDAFSIASSDGDVPLGQWVHAAFVGDSAAGEHRLYLDGVEVSAGGTPAAYSGLLGSGNNLPAGFTENLGLAIGGKTDDSGVDLEASGGLLHGRIDEVGIFDSALTGAQINQIITDAQNGIQLDGTSVPFLNLEIDRGTGEVTIVNSTPVPIDIKAYEVFSPDENLSPSALNSLAGESGFPVGDGSGNGWETDGANDSSQILEEYLTGFSSFGVGAISIGNIFNGSDAVDEDLSLRYSTSAGSIIEIPSSLVSYIGEYAAGTPGDFDGDGDVDGADFLKWQRDGLGASDLADWEANYGTVTPPLSASSTQVPEPSSVVIIVAVLVLGFAASPRSNK